jgi:hypothetical protein
MDMQAFLSTYGIWILLGLSVLFMFRMHAGHGMDHGGGHDHSQGDGEPDARPGEPEAAGTAHRHSGCC